MNLEQQKKQARELLLAIRSGNADALSRLRRRHTRWATSDDAALRQLVSLHDTQFVLAREQGFASWPKLKAFVDGANVARFAGAVRAGDVAQVRAMLARPCRPAGDS